MAAIDYTVDGLVTSVLRSVTSANSQNLFTTTDILAFLDEEMRGTIIPLINSVRGEYFVYDYDQQVDGRTTGYDFPARAAGMMLRLVCFLDVNGNEINLQYMDPSQIVSVYPFGYQLPVYTFGYYIQNNQIFLYPSQTQQQTAYKIRMKFLRRPNTLTSSANCGQITNINGNDVTLTYVDPSWTTSDTFDIIENQPPFDKIADGQAITNISSLIITFSAIPDGLAVGQWFCPVNQSCIAQIPWEAFPLLIKRGAYRIFLAFGDSQGVQLNEKEYELSAQNFVGLIQPRAQGNNKKIVNRNNSMWSNGFGSSWMR